MPQDFGIESIVGHPNYNPDQLYHDIALIKLDKDATITDKVRPACLWQQNAINFTDVTATGYGHTEFGKNLTEICLIANFMFVQSFTGGVAANKLLKVSLQLFNNEQCSTAYKNERSLTNGIVDSQLCAGDSTGMRDTCQVGSEYVRIVHCRVFAMTHHYFQGDSGGPAQVSTINDRQIVYHVVGVTSFGSACATTLPGVYTRVSHYLDFIESIVWP